MPTKLTTLFILWVALLMATATPSGAVRPQPKRTVLAVEFITSSWLSLEPQVEYEKAVVRLRGPERSELRLAFAAGKPIQIQLAADDGAPLADGRYVYELRLMSGSQRARLQRGVFFVENGAAVSRAVKRAQLADVRQELNVERREKRQGEIEGPPQGMTTDDYFYVLDADNDGYTVLGLESYLYGYHFLENYYGYLDFRNGDSLDTSYFNATIDGATGYFGVGTGFPDATLHVYGSTILEGDVEMGSSREIKHELAPASADEVLTGLLNLPIYTWKYRDDPRQATHVGPMAEDFHASFGLGKHNRSLSPVDTVGVAFAAIQALHAELEEEVTELQEANAKLQADKAELRRSLEAENAELRRRLMALEESLARLAEHPVTRSRSSPVP